MKLFSFIFKKKQEKNTESKKASYVFDSVWPSKKIYEIAMGIRTEENSEKK